MNADFKISDQCCNIMKKKPSKKYEKETGRKPFIGTMATESSHRMTLYLKGECNAFRAKRPVRIFGNILTAIKYLTALFTIKDSNGLAVCFV